MVLHKGLVAWSLSCDCLLFPARLCCKGHLAIWYGNSGKLKLDLADTFFLGRPDHNGDVVAQQCDQL